MKVLVAIDSFKGSLSSIEAGKAVKEAINMVNPDIKVLVKPLADGGEGTMDALISMADSQNIDIKVTGPLFTTINCKYSVIKSTNTVVIEVASVIGLTLITPEERNPLKTTTYGVGELIKDAIQRGYRRFIICLGGSATNDGGVGMLSALGYRFLDKEGKTIHPCAEGLRDLYEINTTNVMPQLNDCFFDVACDVTNPLCGENGCSKVFSIQKGATEQMAAEMDKWLYKYSEIVEKISDKSNKDYAGAGAAGGLGFAFLSFLNSQLKSGIDIILEESRIEKDIKDADIVVTGEGCLDKQTIMGKAPIGIARLAQKYNKKVIAFSGCVTDDVSICNEYGIDAFFPIIRNITTIEKALDSKNAYKNLRDTAHQVFRLINIL